MLLCLVWFCKDNLKSVCLGLGNENLSCVCLVSILCDCLFSAFCVYFYSMLYILKAPACRKSVKVILRQLNGRLSIELSVVVPR